MLGGFSADLSISMPNLVARKRRVVERDRCARRKKKDAAELVQIMRSSVHLTFLTLGRRLIVTDAKQMDGPRAKYLLTLYVSGSSSRSEVAIQNLRRLCDTELDDRYELEIVDVLQHPERAEDARILATPTLIKQLPPPLRRVIGD